MQHTSKYIKQHTPANRGSNGRQQPQWLMLMLLLVMAVQASAFTLWPPAKSLLAATKGDTVQQQQPGTTHVAAIYPFEAVPSGLEIELLEEAEIEDELDEYWTSIVNAVFSNEEFYTSAERSRFLQHHAALHNRQSVPYFILYHSWKSYLA